MPHDSTLDAKPHALNSLVLFGNVEFALDGTLVAVTLRPYLPDHPRWGKRTDAVRVLAPNTESGINLLRAEVDAIIARAS